MKNLLKVVFGSLLSLLGFSSCDIVKGGYCMYGQPHADFTVKGTVTDVEGKPVEGIRTVVDAYQKWTDDAGIEYSNLDYTDTLYTNVNGKIESRATLFSRPSEVMITISDMDGEENGGEFEEQVINDPEIKTVKKGDGEWYIGAYEASFKVTLKKKN